MRRVFDYLRGYARVRLTGGDPSQCLNRFLRDGIPFWNVIWQDNFTLYCRIYVRDCTAAEHAAMHCLCLMDIQEVHSFRRSFSGLRHRIVLLTGIVVVLVGLTVLPRFIWTLEVVGNKSVPAEEILRNLDLLGVHFGTWEPSIDHYRLKNQMMNLVPELRWIAVNCSGGRAQVLVAERSVGAPVEDKHCGSCNLVASIDGVVSSVHVLNGQAACAPGDAILEGQILVSGIVDLERCCVMTRAIGEVFATTHHDVQLVTPSLTVSMSIDRPSGKCIYLTLGRKRIKLCGNSGILESTCVKMINRKVLTLPDGAELPAAITVETYAAAERVEMPVDALLAQSYLEDSMLRILQNKMIAGKILSQEVRITEQNDCYCLSGDVMCREMIARTAQIPMMERDDTNDGTDN